MKTKSIKPNIGALMSVICIMALLVIAYNYTELRISAPQLFMKVAGHLRENSGVYLMYIGTINLAIYYLCNQRWAASIFIFLIGVLWLGYYDSTIGLIGQLGSDSFHEARAFEIKEAMFWFQTFASQAQFLISFKELLLYNILALSIGIGIYFVSSVNSLLQIKFHVVLPILAYVFITTALYQSIGVAFKLFYKNSQSFENVAEKFENVSPSAEAQENINVLLYIGESTSIMNMSLYGYGRKTTPLLSKLEQEDKSLLKFENIFSTHTHTSPSLLEALSIGLYPNENKLPITDRRRVSIIDVLNTAGVNTELYSNQGQTGTWNFASTLIFKNAAKRLFSTNSKFVGNANNILTKPFDHKFFHEHFTTEVLDGKSSSLLVFHSYAGHGSYLSNIPPAFRSRVDDFYQQFNQKAITGKSNTSLESIEAYDSAIKYIDFAVYGAIDAVINTTQPWVFLYFADHGDAVFPNRGHDSSRFIHEMARIPFIIYFNDAAKSAYPDLFKKYVHLSRTKNIATLSQLPATLFDLLGVVIDPAKASLPLIGAPAEVLPIVIRETNDGITAINLTSQLLVDDSLIDKTDTATQYFSANHRGNINSPNICYHRSNTIAKVLRGSLVTNCLEIDIVVDDDSNVYSYHPPAENTNLFLSDIFRVLKLNKKLAFWLDGKNLSSRRTCSDFSTFLAKAMPTESSGILVEFPTGSHKVTNEIAECLSSLVKKNLVFTSYYVPTKLAVDCSKYILFGQAFEKTASCMSLKAELEAVKETGLFTDISFDFSGITAIEELNFLSSMSWNTWGVTKEELEHISPSRFRMIILNNDDPNSI